MSTYDPVTHPQDRRRVIAIPKILDVTPAILRAHGDQVIVLVCPLCLALVFSPVDHANFHDLRGDHLAGAPAPKPPATDHQAEEQFAAHHVHIVTGAGKRAWCGIPDPGNHVNHPSLANCPACIRVANNQHRSNATVADVLRQISG